MGEVNIMTAMGATRTGAKENRGRRMSRAAAARQLTKAMRALDSESGYELSDPLIEDFDHFRQVPSRRL